GHLNRWTKQLACRGNVRNIDAAGRSGAMRLYTSMDLARLFRSLDALFPGCRPPTLIKTESGRDLRERSTGYSALVQLMATTDRTELVSDEVEALTGIRSRNLKTAFGSAKVLHAASLYGWALVVARGRGNKTRLVRANRLAA